MMVTCAFLSTLAGAWLVYLASPRQRLLQLVQRTLVMRLAGGLLIALGAAIWLLAIGTGAGIAAALTALMLAWVALPYLAWWRQPAPRARAIRR